MTDRPLILLVDDEADFLEIISTKLTSSGFTVSVAHNATQAITIARKIHPDLILMDISMPGESGTDAVVALKQDPATQDTKIAFLSNMKDPWPRTAMPRNDLAKSLGAEGFIDKSADLDVIVANVKEILGR